VSLAAVPLPGFAAPTEFEPPAPKVDPDFAAGKSAIEAKQWQVAIKSFTSAVQHDGRNADSENYLGYAYRNAGDLDAAFKHYERALQLNPRHRGAHEYMGEAYLLARQVDKAEEHLAQLKSICRSSCEEFDDLAKSIARYRAQGSK